MPGLFNRPTPYKGQEYSSLRKEAQESGHPFIDGTFPPDDKSLFSTPGKMVGIEWKRPKDISENPQLFVEGASSNDLNQGELGNCWFVAASSCLAINKTIWQKVIPDHKEQEWDAKAPEKYCGIFHFQFWRYGEWVDVVIDDFLPSRNGKLVFVHSKTPNEFWSALLEKAYAKLFGSYEALDGGELSEALEDFTGGVSEPIDMVTEKYKDDEPRRDELFKVMKDSISNHALLAAAIPAKGKDEMEQSTDSGLVIGHAYGITAVKRVAIAGSGLFNMFNQDKLSMIRLRNPWGGSEWKGAFSDGSKEWEKIDSGSREKIGLTFEDDGEFWMTFDDYCKYFHNMAICRVVNTSFLSLEKKWHEAVFNGEWQAPSRSGGCINNKETVLQNPQFVFDVTEKEDECLFELVQKSGRGANDQPKQTVGFSIIKVEQNRHYRLHQLQEVIKSSSFKNSRGIFLRHTLTKGRYVAVVCTFEAGKNGNFLFRLYTGAGNKGRELLLDKPDAGLCSWCCIPMCRYPVCITQVKVIRAVGLEKQDRIGGADPYCIIQCEGEKVTSEVAKDTTNPEWNVSAIFYRREPTKKAIIVDIWNSNPIKDDFMGRYTTQAANDVVGKIYEAELVDREKVPTKRPGKIYIQITTNKNMLTL